MFGKNGMNRHYLPITYRTYIPNLLHCLWARVLLAKYNDINNFNNMGSGGIIMWALRHVAIWPGADRTSVDDILHASFVFLLLDVGEASFGDIFKILILTV